MTDDHGVSISGLNRDKLEFLILALQSAALITYHGCMREMSCASKALSISQKLGEEAVNAVKAAIIEDMTFDEQTKAMGAAIARIDMEFA